MRNEIRESHAVSAIIAAIIEITTSVILIHVLPYPKLLFLNAMIYTFGSGCNGRLWSEGDGCGRMPAITIPAKIGMEELVTL